MQSKNLMSALALVLLAALLAAPAWADDDDDDDRGGTACRGLPSHGQLKAAMESVVDVGNAAANGGLANDMWATVVNRDGIVCAVVFTGNDRGDQWPGSRVISAQKANTSNAFSLPNGAGGVFNGLALSTANLFFATQPAKSLFGLQFSNPVNPEVAYRGNAKKYGKPNDPMRGGRIGGVNVFGGGLGLYKANGELIGGIGVSGDTSCTDHNVAWKVRDSLGLDNPPSGVAGVGTEDNIVYDLVVDGTSGELTSASGFGHPECDATATAIAADFINTHPTGPNP